MPTTDAEVIAKLDEVQVFGLTLWAEGRSQSISGIVAIGCAIRNRVKDLRWPDNYRAVCLQPKQFSCWNNEASGPYQADANHHKLMAQAERLVMKIDPIDPALRECLFVAQAITEGRFLDRTGGANHYYTGAVPKWAQNQTGKTIDDHLFLRLT